MKNFIVVLVLLTSALAVSFGDFTEPADSSSFENEHVKALFHVDQPTNTIIFYMKFKAYGYFGLLLGDEMENVRLC